MIKSVIFDLDGTLVDSLDALWGAFNDGVAAFHLPPVTRDVLMGWMNRGTPLADILTGTYTGLSGGADLARPADIMLAIKEQYLARCTEETVLEDGAAALLARLKERPLKLGVVTSRTVAVQKVWAELERLHIGGMVDAVVTAADLPRKPAPDGVLACLKQLAVAPGEALLVGDSRADIRAGKAAGVRTVAIAGGVSSREGLAAESPDFIFDNLPGLSRQLDAVLAGVKPNRRGER